MSGSVVVNLLALFILLMSLLATSCVVAFLRKRWLLFRRRSVVERKIQAALINPDHAAEV